MNSKFSFVLVVFLTLLTHSIYAEPAAAHNPGIIYTMGSGYGESHMSKELAEIGKQLVGVQKMIDAAAKALNKENLDKAQTDKLNADIVKLEKTRLELEEAQFGLIQAVGKSAKRRAHKGSPESAIIMMVNKMDDFAEVMAGIDWSDENVRPTDYFGYIAKAAAIRASAGIASRFGDEIDQKVGNVVTPFFTKVSNACVRAYRFIFKNNKDPFTPQEVVYWRDRVISLLNLLIDTTKNLQEVEDRDRQQRSRDILKMYSMNGAGQTPEVVSDAAQDSTQDAEQEGASEVLHASFAQQIVSTCIVRQLDRITAYIEDRLAYYASSRNTASIDGQIVDMGNVIHDALASLKKEIQSKQGKLKEISSAEFKAIIPYYIRYIAESFDGLCHLVDDGGTLKQKNTSTQTRTKQRGTWGNPRKKKVGFGFD